eukprot:TRINITY_DN5742_c0_g1_i1.p1 TRINITY_DN5742_c0_g1~~TRINITY_DN5742_c0_g1_i1.p1  ORF type:complete len:343 (+),score=85.98 TRINITY_DN5742_c0_g1_i1:121-1149(+)
MKLLDVPEFTWLNAVLDCVGCSDCRVSCRVEGYSCKKVQSDKRLAKHVQQRARSSPLSAPAEAQLGFPPLSLLGGSPCPAPAAASHAGGPRVLGADDADDAANFIATINVSFPDHDFSDVYPWSFTAEDPAKVRKTVGAKLAEPLAQLSANGTALDLGEFWGAIEKVLQSLDGCAWYSFNPTSNDSPFDDAIWSHFYFICNKSPEVNKIVFIHLHADCDSDDVPSPRSTAEAAGRRQDEVEERRRSPSAHSPPSPQSVRPVFLREGAGSQSPERDPGDAEQSAADGLLEVDHRQLGEDAAPPSPAAVEPPVAPPPPIPPRRRAAPSAGLGAPQPAKVPRVGA